MYTFAPQLRNGAKKYKKLTTPELSPPLNILNLLQLKLNLWRYSSEEPRLTEVVTATLQFRRPCG